MGIFELLSLATLLKKKKNLSEFFQPEPNQKAVRDSSEFHLLVFTCPCSLGMAEEGSSWPAGTELECKAEGTSHSHKCMEEEDLKKTTFCSAGRLKVLTEN